MMVKWCVTTRIRHFCAPLAKKNSLQDFVLWSTLKKTLSFGSTTETHNPSRYRQPPQSFHDFYSRWQSQWENDNCRCCSCTLKHCDNNCLYSVYFSVFLHSSPQLWRKTSAHGQGQRGGCEVQTTVTCMARYACFPFQMIKLIEDCCWLTRENRMTLTQHTQLSW